MPTRDDVYLTFGRLSELAQLLETELGTVLASWEVLDRSLHVRRDTDAASRLIASVDQNTLGSTLSAIRSRFGIPDDLDAIFTRALNARNVLTHHFYRRHGLDIETDAGRAAMITHLDAELRPALESAHRIACHLSDIMVKSVMLSRDSQP